MTKHSRTPPAFAEQPQKKQARHSLFAEETLIQLDSSAAGLSAQIAMGKAGTEVTKQAADMVITDDNFASIVAAVEEGRGIYDNIPKTLQYLLADNSGELLLMTVCVAVGLPTPLLPIHLLWINLVTNGLPALCLATDPIDPGLMPREPRPCSECITTPNFLRAMGFTGLLTAAVAFAVYFYILKKETTEIARTYVSRESSLLIYTPMHAVSVLAPSSPWRRVSSCACWVTPKCCLWEKTFGGIQQ